MDDTKIYFAQRKHLSTVNASFPGDFISLKAAVVMNEKPFRREKESSIVLGENGKTHFDQKYGAYQDQPQGIKLVDHLEHSKDFRYRGKQFMTISYPDDDNFKPTVRQFHGTHAKMPSESCMGLAHVWTGKMRVPCNESGRYDMEGYMNRKQRLRSIEQVRNGIPAASEGDKHYKEANREPGFYRTEGLIPGSTIGLRKTGKPEFKKREDGRKTFQMTKSTMTFAEKQKKASLDYELQQIDSLNNPSEKLQQKVPSWEERTGLWLVKPEDEKY